MPTITQTELTAIAMPGFVNLDVISATITHDEYRAPFAQVALVCHMTTVQQAIDLDPTKALITVELTSTTRYGVSDSVATLSAEPAGANTLAALTAYYPTGTLATDSAAHYFSFNGGTVVTEPPFVRKSIYTLRSRSINHRDGTFTLTLASLEALLMDDAHVSTAPFTPTVDAPGKITNLIHYVLSRIGIGPKLDFIPSNYPTPFLPVTDEPSPKAVLLPWKPGVSAYDYLYAHVRDANLFLWCDDRGTFHYGRRRWGADNVNIDTLILTPATNLTDADDVSSRDQDWFTAAVIKFQWVDTAGVSQEAWDAASTGQTPTRIYTETRDTPYPGPGTAAAFLATGAGQTRVNTTTAVADYSATVGQYSQLTLPGAADQAGQVSAITWNYPGDTMTVRTRATRDLT